MPISHAARRKVDVARLVAVELGSDTLVAHATDLRWRIKVVQMPTAPA